MRMQWTLILAAALYLISPAQAGIRADLSGDAVIDFQTTMDLPLMAVGNVGNAADNTGLGAVDYAYRIGKFEVTAGQYTEFLNAVATTDTYGVYHESMLTHSKGCMIQRSGLPGSYSYSVASDRARRPVNFVSWGDSARFANWLTNGRPTGEQNLLTTEDGSYLLDGAVTTPDLQAITRRPNARYVIPSEDEWYKAAYYDGDDAYYDYPTGTDVDPSNVLVDPDPGNNGNFDGYTIGSPYWMTEVGEFENSASPYGTFDQGGNVEEWNEAIVTVTDRGLRGGSFYSRSGGYYLRADVRGSYQANDWSYYTLGFRIAEVPEPATMSLLALGGLTLLRRKREMT